ncbi:homeodomain-interacting protein kinase 1-like [Boleophthalmus pectinirostris]|uniref:homeodomain-interacting protein kinase 1-like n=1 Tax=Boleophthalmus pectinirostris TaxID=150288 RepID=UPI00242BDB36|nr:homeodomain-interacting protein kinase 1-like [Boleophthalmus pectinirostris]
MVRKYKHLYDATLSDKMARNLRRDIANMVQAQMNIILEKFPDELKTLEQAGDHVISPHRVQVHQIPERGAFGQVVQCRIKDTLQDVAVKLPLFQQDTKDEISILTRLMEEGCDQRNIVTFLEAFDTRLGKVMIFEALDMSLYDYHRTNAPLRLSDVRTITKQVATALDALKEMSIIHADIKQGNVMVVDHRQRPPQVKLIDFGLARPAKEAKLGRRIHHVCHSRPPEIILGLPWNEAVDVWSLGTMFADLWLGIK